MFTMEQDFYKNRLVDRYGLDVIVLNSDDRQLVHKIIYEKLCFGVIKEDSKAEYLRVLNTLASQRAETVILGCTEIGLLVNQSDTNVKLLDTTEKHAKNVVEYARA